jgi:undecaprenyl diphosphate synthase
MLMTESVPPSVPQDYPEHVAIIMDGNGRWAQERGERRLEGHRQGAQVVRNITTCAREMGIRYLTLYSFSRQNWRRPPDEVAGLMALLEDYCQKERDTLMRHEIRLTTIGDTKRLPTATQDALLGLAEATAHNGKMTLCLAVDYGGREEIVSAVRRLARQVQGAELTADAIDEAAITRHLDTACMPDPDLLIRTSGEKRVSNFLLWQLAYSELHFSPVRWPDFGRQHFIAALDDYSRRQRRFGHTHVVRPRGPITDFHEGFDLGAFQDFPPDLDKDVNPC